jgi:pyrroloquinoline quinone (PQQ) biosynthesis protein C
MNELTNNVKSITNPQQAVQEYMGEQFIEWLMDYIPQQMQTWPILRKIHETRATPSKIRKFVLQIYLVAEAFFGGREGDPGFLRFAIANLSESDDPQAEGVLEILEQRREDEMIGHKVEKGIVRTVNQEQWHKLLLGLGISEEEIGHAEPKEPTRNYVAELSDLCSSSEWQIAVGALASLEASVACEYQAIISLLKNNFPVADKDLQVLTDLIGTENKYSNSNHILDKVVFDQEAKDLVWQGVSRELDIMQDFLKGLEKYLDN